MKNYKKKIINLNFHDSIILSIKITNDDFFNRKTILIIDYYNWEGNIDDNDEWKHKILKLTFHHMVHFKFNAPNLMEDNFEILDVEYDEKFNEFIKKTKINQKSSYFKYLKTKKLRNFLSIKFKTNNFNDSLFNEECGFIWIAGFNVDHEWDETYNIEGKMHIPIPKKNSNRQ